MLEELNETQGDSIENAQAKHPQLNYVDDRDEALKAADAVVVVRGDEDSHFRAGN